ncbi:uncharacterized protein C8R40DRAFT_1172204 [Lentinula edodes]|uniref:uncharacterized protein n=1 Tax=Lentinula edodes TaxID=5353 RepID=UPI001E8D859A|nr:uncharacterized protein C8R40DRAFT_1172204 [Lentinula edodes]KAH7873862.1 hypothetical protein C8R40DRAFT_1172204 [Lentinula edodes]
MLSAIAARKAATAAAASGGVKGDSYSTSASTSTVSTSISTPITKSKPRPTPSKRKHSSTGAALDGSITAKKRRRRERDVLEKPRAPRSRYFEQGRPAATEGEDGVGRDEDDEEEEEEDWDGSNSDVKVQTTATRGYSPSRPISPDDSSDEEQVQNGSIQPEPQTQTQSQVLLTTFVPIPGQNTFYLSPDELSLVLSAEKSTVPATLIALGPSENLTLLGTYRLTVIRGSIEIGGAILRSRVHPETHNVFAPRSSPVPSIRVVSSAPSSRSPALFPLRIQHEIDALVGDPVLVLLQELRSGVEALGKVCRTFDGVFDVHPRDVLNRNRELEEEAEDVLRLRSVRIITHQSKYVSPLVIPPSWEKALDEVSTQNLECHDDDDDSETERKHPPNIYLIKGPKKVGKSSFARTLVNRLLSQHNTIAYLDLDPGQSEFTPAGLIALTLVSDPVLGPPWTHPSVPLRAHFIGAFSPKGCPSLYVEGVRDLVRFWGEEVCWGGSKSAIPLVVNTMGWAKGLGVDLMKRIQDVLVVDGVEKVSYETCFGSRSGSESRAVMCVYEFGQSENEMGNGRQRGMDGLPLERSSFFGEGATSRVDYHQHPPPGIQIHNLEPVPVSASNTLSLLFSAADQRTMNIMSYFHAVFPSSSSSSSSYTAAPHWDASLPLLARPPYQVDVGRALDRVFLLGGGGEVIKAEIENVLGGAVVALVRCEPGTLDAIDDNDDDSTQGQNQLGEVGTKIPYFPTSTSASSYPSPSTSSAVGLALVRSVAPGGSHLHVLTPLPLSAILSSSSISSGLNLSKSLDMGMGMGMGTGAAGARVLVKGEMEIPIWGMVDFRRLGGRGVNGGEGEEQRDIPFLQWEKGVGVGAERRRVRRNLMRKGQGV